MILLERQPVKSRILRSVGYDESTKILEIEFQTGLVYQYLAVPPKVYANLMHSNEIGKYFSEKVRPSSGQNRLSHRLHPRWSPYISGWIQSYQQYCSIGVSTASNQLRQPRNDQHAYRPLTASTNPLSCCNFSVMLIDVPGMVVTGNRDLKSRARNSFLCSNGFSNDFPLISTCAEPLT